MRPEIKRLKKQCDDLWSEIVKLKAGYKCEKCGKGKPDVVLNSHHIITRERKSTRWHVSNGVCLCFHDHFYWAHVDTEGFREWCQKIRDYDDLNFRRKMPFKLDYMAIKLYLEQELKKLKEC